jgi:hypothetical protein
LIATTIKTPQHGTYASPSVITRNFTSANEYQHESNGESFHNASQDIPAGSEGSSHVSPPISVRTGTEHPERSTDALIGISYQCSEEDAQVQTLHRMADESSQAHLSVSTTGDSNSPHNKQVVEYFDRLNTVAILNDALGHRQRKRLVHVDLSGPEYTTAKKRELAGLDLSEVAYLDTKRVFEKPPRHAW